MLTTFWAAKGGSGTSVVAAAHAVVAAPRRPTLLVDLDGDLPAALGVEAPPLGVAEWLSAGSEVPRDALDRIAVDVTDGLRLLGRGDGPLDDVARLTVLAELLVAHRCPTVVDAGTLPSVAGALFAGRAERSVLVTRPCYLAIRRARAATVAATEAVVVREPGRALRDRDIAEALAIPVRTSLPFDIGVARAVDAGLLATRLPWTARRALRRLEGPMSR